MGWNQEPSAAKVVELVLKETRDKYDTRILMVSVDDPNLVDFTAPFIGKRQVQDDIEDVAEWIQFGYHPLGFLAWDPKEEEFGPWTRPYNVSQAVSQIFPWLKDDTDLCALFEELVEDEVNETVNADWEDIERIRFFYLQRDRYISPRRVNTR